MFDIEITPAGVREDLVACCEDAAEWRLRRAAEFSNNGRNLAAVDALEAAAECLAGLPDDDPRLKRLARVWKRLGGEERLLAFTESRRVVTRHGYDGDGTLGALFAQLIQVGEVIPFNRSKGRENASSALQTLRVHAGSDATLRPFGVTSE